MLTTSSTITNNPTDAVQMITFLDLSKIKNRVMKRNGWTEDQTNVAEKWYRRFLILAVKYPDRKLIPSALIDEMWHQHILDTEKYSRDCDHIFGKFMHHNPSGTPEEGASIRDQLFAETKELYRSEFGEVHMRSMIPMDHGHDDDVSLSGSRAVTCCDYFIPLPTL